MNLKLLFLLLTLFPACVGAQNAPARGEIRLEGTVVSLARDGQSFRLEVEAFTLPNGKTARLKALKTKTVTLSPDAAIFPLGAAKWKLKAAALRVGYGAFVIGPDDGGAELKARRVALRREIESRPIDIFVAQNGSDAGDGSNDKPFRSVQGAVNAAPSGFADEATVIHIGAGDFVQASGQRAEPLLIEGKRNLILTGAGATYEGGTQISTGTLAKTRNNDVVRILASQNIELCNLVIGDDRSWEEDRDREATLKLALKSSVVLRNVRLAGPTRETLLDAGGDKPPTASVALRPFDRDSVATLENVLVTGHGSFLSNPRGKVFCRNVTFARMFGTGYDDHFLFLQTPSDTPPNERRFTFENCLFYEMEGGRGGWRFILSGGDEGLDKAFFDPPRAGGGNIMVRCRFEKPSTYFTAEQLGAAFLDTRGGVAARSHGVWVDDDPKKALAGGVRIDNAIQLEKRDGFALCAPPSLGSGWSGGFFSPLLNGA